jgi:ubiquitin-like-conjugating enzyme ATG3
MVEVTNTFDDVAHPQDKQPLTPAQVFQDVPADHAFKTMTMEAFPHSGQQLASVHPCKHASVMKKFIDRMEEARSDSGAAGFAPAARAAPAPTGKEEGTKSRKWGLGGVMRKVTGGSSAPAAQAGDKKDAEAHEAEGVQVDFYLVIVSVQKGMA